MNQNNSNSLLDKDGFTHQSYYNKGKIEVIDFIEDQELNFSLGNAVKYVCRAGLKDPKAHIKDLGKAVWYIRREIKRLEELNGSTESRTGTNTYRTEG